MTIVTKSILRSSTIVFNLPYSVHRGNCSEGLSGLAKALLQVVSSASVAIAATCYVTLCSMLSAYVIDASRLLMKRSATSGKPSAVKCASKPVSSLDIKIRRNAFTFAMILSNEVTL